MAGIYGWLPPPMSGPALNLTIVQNTADKILELWDLEESYGWDFSLLAMNSLRLGDVNQAIAYLLHPVFQFDDAGYPVGGSRVPTPYFPNAASLLLASTYKTIPTQMTISIAQEMLFVSSRCDYKGTKVANMRQRL